MADRDNKGKFQKGHKGYKPKGATSLYKRQWDAIGKYISDDGADRFLEILEDSDDKEYVDKFLAILNYFKPKLASTTNENKNSNVHSFKFKIDGE